MRVTTVVELSAKEQDFLYALTQGRPPTVAAIEAGYAMSSAKLLLAKPHVRAALEDVKRNASRVLDKLERRDAERGTK